MMTKIVNSWNDWDPLKRVIVGRADNSVIPPEEPATSEKVPVDSAMRGMWGPRPLETVEKANAQLDNLVDVLEKHGVQVDRPTPLQWNQAIGTIVVPDKISGLNVGLVVQFIKLRAHCL